MKKEYITPTMMVVLTQPAAIICGSGDEPGKNVDGNNEADPAEQMSRRRNYNVWDEEELEEDR